MGTRSGMTPAMRRYSSVLRKAGLTRETALSNAISVVGPDVASAATITLNYPSQDVTGVATISAITSAPEGQRRMARFTGAGTLTYNASSMILPGAASITRAANDVAHFYSLGSGNWICEAYILANGTVFGVVPITLGGTSNTTAVAAIDALHTAGTDIASAGTINLDTATGQVVTITGSTTITDITLAEGKPRRCRLSGSPKIAYNASKILTPGLSDIQGAAGDRFEVVGKASSVVEIRSYVRAAVAPLVANVFHPNVRLSPDTGIVLATEWSSKTAIYADPFLGNQLPLYDGVEWKSYSFTSMVINTQTSQTGATHNGTKVIDGLSDTSQLCRGMKVTGTNVGAAAVISSIDSASQVTVSVNSTGSATNTITFNIPSGSVVDVFAILSSGSPVLRFGNLWASTITRTDNVGQNTTTGIFTNLSAINATDSNTIPIYQGLCLGSVYCSSDGTYHDKASHRHLANAYNRRARCMSVVDTTNTWNYSTASYQQANASAANQLDFLTCGLGDDDAVWARVTGNAINSTATARAIAVGIGVDSATVNSAIIYEQVTCTSTLARCVHAEYIGTLAGRHYLAWLEQGAGTADTETWRGDSGTTTLQTGMVGVVYT